MDLINQPGDTRGDQNTVILKSSLDHLPAGKQEIIQKTVKKIVERFDPTMVILYGSYATGKWVEDYYIEDHIGYEYVSDYDYLVIVEDKSESFKNHVNHIQDYYLRKYKIEINIICYDIYEINGRLEEGMFFFADIQKEGILLYDNHKFTLSKRRQLTAAEKKAVAQEHFDIWFQPAQNALMLAEVCITNNDPYDADFLLHQSMERAYNAILPIFWGNRPKTHNLDKLRQFGKPYSIELMKVFPKSDKDEVHLFNQLKKGYVDARYKRKTFVVTVAEVSEIAKRMKIFLDITEEICLRKISDYDKE